MSYIGVIKRLTQKNPSLRFVFKHSGVIGFFVLLFVSLWAAKGTFLFPYFGSHDGAYMLIRALTAKNLLLVGQFPLRWSGVLQEFCGLPVFTFFYPLGPLVVALLTLVSPLSLPMAMEVMYASTFIIGTLFFYLWSREVVHDDMASVLGGFLYLFVPYRFVSIYVRGSMEALSYALFPVLLFFIVKALSGRFSRTYFGLAAFCGGLFLLSHNLVVFLLLPFIAIYALYVGRKKIKRAVSLLIIIALLGFHFWIPALLEQKYTKLPDQNPCHCSQTNDE